MGRERRRAGILSGREWMDVQICSANANIKPIVDELPLGRLSCLVGVRAGAGGGRLLKFLSEVDESTKTISTRTLGHLLSLKDLTVYTIYPIFLLIGLPIHILTSHAYTFNNAFFNFNKIDIRTKR